MTMPSKSKKQAKLMAAVAHSPKFAKKVGISQSVGREFNNADRKLRRYAEGGKVDHAKRVVKLMKDVGNRFSRQRLERMLDENPGFADYVDPNQLIYMARSDAPLMPITPEEFLQLSRKQDGFTGTEAETAAGILRRSERLLKKLKKGVKLHTSPEFGYEWTPQGIKIVRHDGRARSTAFRELGLESMPVEMAPEVELHKYLRTGRDPDMSRADAAREINDMDIILPEERGLSIRAKDRAFAEGGKVGVAQRLLDVLNSTQWGENTEDYKRLLMQKAWVPPEGDYDLGLMEDWADGSMYGWNADDPRIGFMNDLIKKYGIRPTRTQTYRGLVIPKDVVSDFKPGDFISSHKPQSSTTDLDIADEFSGLNILGDDSQPVILRIAPSQRKILPLPQSGQSEMIIPAGEAGKLGINKIRRNDWGTYEMEVDPVPHPGFADGGRVLPSSTEDTESWSDTYLKRPLSGLASMWGATDPETGEFVNPAWHNIKRVLRSDSRRKAGLPREEMATLGIADEALSLPALGEIVGLPAPKFAKKAEGRASATREAARGSLGLDAPHGFTENLTESAGVMAGQLPVPGTLANRLKILKNRSLMGKIAGPAVEWFSPTVVPRAGNYASGALFGGALGGGLDYLEDHLDEKEQLERSREFISEAMAEVLEEERQVAARESGDDTSDEEAMAELGYAEGGRVKQAKRVIGSLRSLLSETSTDDVTARKAAIDQALASIKGTTGPTEMDRVQLHTLGTGLSDAASTPIPERRRQRFGDYEQNILNLLERRVAPTLTDPTVPKDLPVVSNMPPPPRVPKPDPALPHVRLDQDLGPMRPDQVLAPADNRQGALSQEEWERLVGLKQQFASGGKVVGYNPWDTPQSQKEAFTTSPTSDSSSPGRQGAPLSQDWYETYGEGPEHLFLGERNIPDLKGWTPQHQGMPQVPQAGGKSGSSTFNNIAGLATLGLMGYDIYKDMWGNDSSPYNLDPSILEGAGDTSAVNQWIQNDFDNMEMPTAEIDPSLWDRTKQGAGGALDMYIGSQQGGVSGAGSMISGGGDLYEAFGGKKAFGDIAGNVGGILQGVGDGSVQGYLQAGGDAVQLAKAMGYTGPILDSAGKLLPVVGQLFSAYEGIRRGDPAGYMQAAGSLYGAASTAGLTSSTGTLATSGLGSAAGLAALGFAVADISNNALGHDNRREDLFAARAGLTPMQPPRPKNSARIPMQQYYITTAGKVIGQKDMEHLHRLSQDAHNKGGEYQKKYDELWARINSDDWHSERVGGTAKEWFESQGYRV
jgi:hypothetical protein